MRSAVPTVVDTDADAFTFCTWRNLNLHVWTGPITASSVERLATFTRTRSDEIPGGLSFVHIIRESARLPDAAVRDSLLALGKRFEHEFGPTAVIIGGEGFWASALRGAVTGLWLAVPKGMPMKMCANAEEVALWLPIRHLASTGVTLEADELCDVLRAADTRDASPPRDSAC